MVNRRSGRLGVYKLKAADTINGRTATKRTTMPIPPSQWVSERQKSMEAAGPLSVRIEAPVVVNPEMVSEKASVNEGWSK